MKSSSIILLALILVKLFAFSQQPNIVIFFSDDHTQQAISAYQNLTGATVQDQVFKDWVPLQTPNIDRLANQGALFAQSYVSNSICQPSRANLLTGLHSHANGQTLNNGGFDGSQQTIPKLLQAAGYDTSLIGKWHLGTEPTGFDHYERLIGQGDYYSPRLRTTQAGGGTSDIFYGGQYVADVITSRAIAWLQARLDGNQNEPFFLMVNHKGTHRLWAPSPTETATAAFRPVEWDFSVIPNPTTHPGEPENWTPAPVPQPSNLRDWANGYPTRAVSASRQEMEISNDLRLNQDLKLATNSFGGTAYDEVRTWWAANGSSLTQEERDDYFHQRYLRDYALTGKSVDRSVGEILDFLEANELDHNTIIIYASDQGFYLGEHGWYDKRWIYEESLRTPLLMQWKDQNGVSKITPGTVVDEMVQVIDYTPTMLEAAGVTGFQPVHGESFLGFATAATGDEPTNWRESIYYHYYEGIGIGGEHKVNQHYGMRNERYKLIYHYEVGQWELFDLQNDPLEMNNLFYNATSQLIDDPTDGIEGDSNFVTLVTDLMERLRGLREQYQDTTGPGFSIPGVDPLDPGVLLNLRPESAAYDGGRIDSGRLLVSQPSLTDGLTLQVNFTPSTTDLGGTVLLAEIGGNSNGSGLYLVNGVPTFIMKKDSSDPDVPASLSDTTLNQVAVQSSFGGLAADLAYRLSIVYTPPPTGTTGTLELCLQPAGGNMIIDSFNLTGDSWTGNWSGNETLSVGIIDPESTYRGGLSITAGIFLSSALKSLQGSVDWALYWNDVGSIVPQVKLSATDFDGTHFSVTVRNLVKGATYRLLRDTTLPLRVGKVEVDATVAGDTPVTLSDSDLPDSRNKAFYQVEEIR